MKLLKLKAVLWMALLVPIWISSCVQEGAFDSAEETLKEGEVKMIIKLKTTDGFAPQSKGLTETEESDIRDVLVFAFRLNKLSYIKEASSVDNSTQKSFTAILNASASSATANNYKSMILANAKTTVATDTWGALIGKSYAEVQAALHKTITGKMYPEASGESIIMWGETGYVNITPEFIPPAIQLLRSVARIDVGVNSDGNNWLGLANFNLKSVSVYRSNKSYALVPLVDNRATEGGKIKVTAPSDIPSKNEIDAPLTYAVENNKLSTVREIYVSESDIKMDDTGLSGDRNHQERMALVIGGSYTGGVETFYRVDFLSGAGKTLANVLRNHQYQFNITQVVGAGYATPKEAYQARAINMSVEVVEWNDATLEDIVFDGQYYLTINQKQVKFNQFGDASENNVITVKTNGGALSIEGFIETAPNSGIYKDPKDYFTITKAGTNNGAQSESVYNLTATAKAVHSGNLLHEASAKIKVRNIGMNIDLYQEIYNPYRLETHPASNSLITVDDSEQLIEVQVSSTKDYSVTSDDELIMNGLYISKDEAGLGSGTFYTNGSTIPNESKTIYLKVSKSTTNGSRVGSVVIEHTDDLSTAKANTLVVIQEKSYLAATLLGLPLIPEKGGAVAIQLNTNLKYWSAEVIETGGANFVAISKTEGGIGTSSIMLDVNRITGPENATRTATIRFTNTDKTITEDIVITQKYIKKTLSVTLSGSAEIPEAGGTREITVSTNLDTWTAEAITGADFVSVSPNTGGSGTSKVTLTIAKITGTEDATRYATIRIKDADGVLTKDIRISQEYIQPILIINKSSHTFIMSKPVSLTLEGAPNQTWNITTIPSWLQENAGRSSGKFDASGKVQLNFSVRSGYVARRTSASILRFASHGLTADVAVTSEPGLIFAKSSLRITWKETNIRLYFDGPRGKRWEITNRPSWLFASAGSGSIATNSSSTQSNYIDFKVPQEADNSVQLAILCEGVTHNITITQKKPYRYGNRYPHTGSAAGVVMRTADADGLQGEYVIHTYIRNQSNWYAYEQECKNRGSYLMSKEDNKKISDDWYTHFDPFMEAGGGWSKMWATSSDYGASQTWYWENKGSGGYYSYAKSHGFKKNGRARCMKKFNAN